MSNLQPTTRLAPSPTGGLHLGNARSFLLNWALARHHGWRVLLRIDDLDRARASIDSEEAQIASLRWLGLDFDGQPRRQSAESTPYQQALERLIAQERVFACDRSRRELRAAAAALGAPHADGASPVSTPSMRPRDPDAWRLHESDVNHRLALEAGEEFVRDELLGDRSIEPLTAFGDPIIWTRERAPAYQLATVVDDMRDGVTDVVRGEDLLPSAGLQQRIARFLGAPAPRWWHLPLMFDHEGRRLAKRDNDQTLESYHQRGVAPERILGLLARTCDVQPTLAPMNISEFMAALDPDRLQRWAQAESAAGGYRLHPDQLTWLEERSS